jgi:muramoyltetrapeptide carboxypeptidase
MTMMKRREALAALGAAGVSLGLPGSAMSAPTPARPGRLRPGDRVALVKPAGFVADDFDLQLTLEAITAMGLVPVPGPHWKDRFGYLAGTDRDRAADLNAAFADDSIRAIMAVRGGWGSARILPLLDWKTIRANPKLLVGFSDITALHLAIQARGGGFPTIHGPNAGSSWSRYSYASFRDLVFDGKLPLYRNLPGDDDRLVQRRGRTRTIRPGKAQGRLLGGNLTVLAHLVGTPWLPSFAGAILFIEDVDEAEYRVDRMLTQLGQAGILRGLAGVVFGQCTDCTAKGGGSGFTLGDVLRQHLEPLGIPAYSGAMFGHVEDQFSLPVGCRAEIDADAGTIRLLESPVA